MKIEITGEAKEIAVLALELQRPQPFTSPIRKRCQRSRCENLLAIWRTVILKTQNPTLFEDIGNHVSNGVGNRS